MPSRRVRSSRSSRRARSSRRVRRSGRVRRSRKSTISKRSSKSRRRVSRKMRGGSEQPTPSEIEKQRLQADTVSGVTRDPKFTWWGDSEGLDTEVIRDAIRDDTNLVPAMITHLRDIYQDDNVEEEAVTELKSRLLNEEIFLTWYLVLTVQQATPNEVAYHDPWDGDLVIYKDIILRSPNLPDNFRRTQKSQVVVKSTLL
jgi:hypothetical protein